jgi:hypothetical protein
MSFTPKNEDRITTSGGCQPLPMMDSRTEIDFADGTWVRERDSDIVGQIAGRAEYPGEWKITLSSGKQQICLGDNLEVI